MNLQNVDVVDSYNTATCLNHSGNDKIRVDTLHVHISDQMLRSS